MKLDEAAPVSFCILYFTELGTTFPQAGEKYVYVAKTIGPFWSFLYLWGYLIFNRFVFYQLHDDHTAISETRAVHSVAGHP